jgi:hypothetical protein
LNDLLETIHHNIPHPLGNVTHLLREAGLNAMADKADKQFFEEGKELENIRTDRSDCQTDDCIAKLDLREQKIEEEREHRLSLLRRALNNVQVERSVTVAPSDFPERTLLIVLMVLLALMVLGLLVLAIALAGYWAKSSKKKEPARLERRPSSEWEWREY